MMWNISMHASRTLLRSCVLALCALPIHGQTANTGAIAGTVSDPSGALVSRAAVVINSQSTGEKRDLATDAEGNFSVRFLTPGNYDLTVRAAGFEPFMLKGVRRLGSIMRANEQVGTDVTNSVTSIVHQRTIILRVLVRLGVYFALVLQL